MITLPQQYREFCAPLPKGTRLWITDILFEDLWMELAVLAGPLRTDDQSWSERFSITYKHTVTIYPKSRYDFTRTP